MQSIKIFAYPVFIVAFAAARWTAGADAQCSPEEMLRCSYPLKVFTDNKELSFVTNKQELDLQCPQLIMGLQCIDEFTERCMTATERSYFIRLYAGTNEVIHDLCRDGSYQREFLKHAPCMRKVRGDFEICAKDYEDKLHQMNALANDSLSSNGDNEYHMRTLCCSFQKYVQCSQDVVERRCGLESANFTGHIFARMGNPFVKNHCKKYSEGTDSCDVFSSSWWSSRIQIGVLVVSLLLPTLARTLMR